MRDGHRLAQDLDPPPQIGNDRDAGVGKEEPPIVARDLHQYDLADHSTSAQARRGIQHGLHQRRRGDLPLHQSLGPTGADLGNRNGCDRGHFGMLDRESVERDHFRLGDRSDSRLVPDQDRPDPPPIGGDPERFQHRGIVAAGRGHANRLRADIGISIQAVESVERHRFRPPTIGAVASARTPTSLPGHRYRARSRSLLKRQVRKRRSRPGPESRKRLSCRSR